MNNLLFVSPNDLNTDVLLVFTSDLYYHHMDYKKNFGRTISRYTQGIWLKLVDNANLIEMWYRWYGGKTNAKYSGISVYWKTINKNIELKMAPLACAHDRGVWINSCNGSNPYWTLVGKVMYLTPPPHITPIILAWVKRIDMFHQNAT